MFIYAKSALVGRSQNFLELLPLLISVCTNIIQKLNLYQLPMSIASHFSEEVDHNDSEYQSKKYNFILNTICENVKFNSDDKTDTVWQLISMKDRLNHELGKNRDLKILEEEKIDFRSSESIIFNTSVFQTHYKSYLKFSQFDESLFIKNLKGDTSPMKINPYKSYNGIKENKNPKVFRVLDFNNCTEFQDNVKEFNHPNQSFNVKIYY